VRRLMMSPGWLTNFMLFKNALVYTAVGRSMPFLSPTTARREARAGSRSGAAIKPKRCKGLPLTLILLPSPSLPNFHIAQTAIPVGVYEFPFPNLDDP